MTAAGFGARQQAIVRRLVGAEVYEREVVPKLTIQSYNKARVMEAVGLTALHEYSVSEDSVSSTIGWSRGSVDVYPQLTPAFFDSLAQYLPEPCRRFIVDDAAFTKHLDPVTRAAAPSEPHCQWLLGCWDAVLLPRYTRCLPSAHIHINLLHGLPQAYQTACLLHTLRLLPGLTHLSLQWEGQSHSRGVQYYPALLSLSALTDALPKLVSLHILRLPLFPSMLDSLMESPSLLQLRLHNLVVCGLDMGADDANMEERGLSFGYPRQWLDAVQLSALRTVEAWKIEANRQLRQALCKWWEEKIEGTEEEDEDEEDELG